jgi:hypothetical protein
MRALRQILPVTLPLLCGAPAVVQADVLLLDAIREAAVVTPAPIARPARGMSAAQVEHRYGTPVEKLAAVGQPPIIRWVYPGFTVYFEDRHVLHSVTGRDGP